jgi:selenocysteine lyase/cysteine desulfurase
MTARETDYRDDFGPFAGRLWLNCAHQGPLPRVAARAVQQALQLKVTPSLLTDDLFVEVPRRVRSLLGRLLNVDPDDVILGNSTSYGLHLLANGMRWQQDDEVLLVRGDYPADILPWLALEKQGVVIRFLEPGGGGVEPEALEQAISSRTRAFCTTWVNSFTGHAVDLHGLGTVCRSRGVSFIVNGSQAVGARPLDLSRTPVDALACCGYKWLCGPYATGFCWIRPDLRDSLVLSQAYWLAMQAGRDLSHMREYTIRDDLGARAFDVFCTANFLDMMPWAASLEYLLDVGIARISAHDQVLVARLLDGLDGAGYRVESPRAGEARSTLVLAQHRDGHRTESVYRTLRDAGIDVALREGLLRFSPHLYNASEDIDRAVAVLGTV